MAAQRKDDSSPAARPTYWTSRIVANQGRVWGETGYKTASAARFLTVSHVCPVIATIVGMVIAAETAQPVIPAAIAAFAVGAIIGVILGVITRKQTWMSLWGVIGCLLFVWMGLYYVVHLHIIFATVVSAVVATLVGTWYGKSDPRLRTYRRGCPYCGYDLAGLPGIGLCPECGRRVEPDSQLT